MAMLCWKRLLFAGLAGILSVPIFGVAIFVGLSYAFRCPPNHPVCDLPDMAAFGLGRLERTAGRRSRSLVRLATAAHPNAPDVIWWRDLSSRWCVWLQTANSGFW